MSDTTCGTGCGAVVAWEPRQAWQKLHDQTCPARRNARPEPAAHWPHGERVCRECEAKSERLFDPPRPPTHCATELAPNTCRWCGAARGPAWASPGTPPKVGETVWLKGWRRGPWLLSSFSDGKARVSSMRGRRLYADWLQSERLEFWPGMLTTEPPPAPEPSPWTPSLIVRCVAGLAALSCALAALVAYAAA